VFDGELSKPAAKENMRFKAAFRLFDKWMTRGVRLSAAYSRHRGKGEILRRRYKDEQCRRWLRHCGRLYALKEHWFGKD
jgi:hypothetical protein